MTVSIETTYYTLGDVSQCRSLCPGLLFVANDGTKFIRYNVTGDEDLRDAMEKETRHNEAESKKVVAMAARDAAPSFGWVEDAPPTKGRTDFARISLQNSTTEEHHTP
jgi:hypothetical protein